jgi:ferredoxin
LDAASANALGGPGSRNFIDFLSPMPTITFVKEKRELQVPQGANLRREMMQAGIAVYTGPHKLLHCPGLSLCGSCRVLITKGMENASPMGLMERTRLKMSLPYIGHEDTMRLACQTEVMGDMTVENTPALNLYGDNFFS